MLVSILQSNYLPWIGVLEMMDRSDVFVYHDDIQYNRSWRNRNRIRIPGEIGWCWLTVPVKLPYRSSTLVNQVTIANERSWQRKHWHLIEQHYRRAPFFDQYSEAYKKILLDNKWEMLVDLNQALISVMLEQIGIKVKIVHSEMLDLGQTAKNARIVKICQRVGADTWLANSACRGYVVPSIYKENKIGLIFQDFFPPVYTQQYEPFIPYLSALDMIFNCGPDTLKMIRQARL